MAKIQVRRGLQAGVTDLVLAEGELAVALDTGNVYVGTEGGKTHVNPKGGTADAAVKLVTSRAFSVTGDATAPAVNFDGTGNVALNLALNNMSGLVAGAYPKVTVDQKGRVTGGGGLLAADIPAIPSGKVTGLGTAASKNTGTDAGDVVEVGADGKISPEILPPLAISDTFVVDAQAKMLALNAQAGDVAIRTDISTTFILSAVPATALVNWKEIVSPGKVVSVNGRTGAVTLTAADVGATDNKVTNTLNPAVKAYVTATTEAATNTGGQVFDTGVYLGVTAGELVASKFTGALAGNAATATSATTAAACSGNAATATKLGTARSISLSGAVTGTAAGFDGSANMVIPVTAVNPANLSASVPVTKGGTGATTAAAALSNLGLTASAAELNYCDGATSNIQAQLNAIAAADIDGGTF